MTNRIKRVAVKRQAEAHNVEQKLLRKFKAHRVVDSRHVFTRSGFTECIAHSVKQDVLAYAKKLVNEQENKMPIEIKLPSYASSLHKRKGAVQCNECKYLATVNKDGSGECSIALTLKLPTWVEITPAIVNRQESCDFGERKQPATDFIL